uniref:Uncharacterized protein n=1 Tax=Glossina brevipalpis TaxID=37001 RepID=A0A1A9W407_9MUSC
MTSSNINKIVRSNLNLKPWVLSKNSTEIVNACIKNIYQQIPNNFRNGLKQTKMASARLENMGPVRSFRNQAPITIPEIKPKPIKKQKIVQRQEKLLSLLGTAEKHSTQIKKNSVANLGSGKKLLKSPNCKIYGSRRFGSSASSSHTSLFRRHDDRHSQRHYPINYLLRSFNTGQFDRTLTKNLVESRNQNVEGRLGSVQDAEKFSSMMLNDLMVVDKAVLRRLSAGARTKSTKKETHFTVKDRLNTWHHPPSIDQFRDITLIDKALQKRTSYDQTAWENISAEHRAFIKKSIPAVPFRHPAPPKEYFTSPHDRDNTELHEKHRRQRMKKLGLIENSPRCSKQRIDNPNSTNGFEESSTQKPQPQPQHQVVETYYAINYPKATSNDKPGGAHNQLESPLAQFEATREVVNRSRRQPSVSHFPAVNTSAASVKQLIASPDNISSPSPLSANAHYQKEELIADDSDQAEQSENLAIKNPDMPIILTSPLAASVNANTNSSYGSYRYNRSSYFPPTKY